MCVEFFFDLFFFDFEKLIFEFLNFRSRELWFMLVCVFIVLRVYDICCIFVLVFVNVIYCKIEISFLWVLRSGLVSCFNCFWSFFRRVWYNLIWFVIRVMIIGECWFLLVFVVVCFMLCDNWLSVVLMFLRFFVEYKLVLMRWFSNCLIVEVREYVVGVLLLWLIVR